MKTILFNKISTSIEFQFLLRRRVVFSIFCLILLNNDFVFSQCTNILSGTYTIGASGNFPTITAAANQYNTSCLSGNIEFLLIDSVYSSSETFPIVFTNNTNASSTNTLTIKPQINNNVRISGSVNNNPILKITGKFIYINGSNNNSNNRNLTIINQSITQPRLILYGSEGTVSVNNCTIKNCTLINGNDRSVITISDATTIANPGYFSNITIENNSIQRSLYGIFAIAKVATGNGSGLLIKNNDLNTNGANSIRNIGIYLKGIDGATVDANTIGNFFNTDSATDKGIYLADSVRNTIVSNNKISNLNYTGTSGYGAHGIYISTGFTNANITLHNNMISNLSGDGSDFTLGRVDNPTGIMIDNVPRDQTGIRIYHNSIFLGGVVGFTNTLNKPNAVSSCIRLKGVCKAEIINNILVNNLGKKDTTGFGAACILTSRGSAQFDGLNYNDYVVSPSGNGVKLFAYTFTGNVSYATLSAWKIATSKDVNSVNLTPTFISGTDLHLNEGNNNLLSNLGTTISGINNDIDSASRSLNKPDIGCDEFVISNTASWVGRISSSWDFAANWEANVIPTENKDVSLSRGSVYVPTGLNLIKVRNLSLASASNEVLLNLDTLQKLEIYGSLSKNGGTINASKSTISMKGEALQTIPANVFESNKVLNLEIANSSVSGVVLSGKLDVYRSLNFSTAGLKLTTNNSLTLKTTLNETAWVGDLTGKKIEGNVTVERFIPTGITHVKSWQLLAVPTFGSQTINQSWQDTATSANQSRYAGYGTMITSSLPNALALGFDAYTAPGGTMKTYNSSDSSYVGIASTQIPIQNSKGYFVFVRGDRTVTTFNATAKPTILRTTGKLYTANVDELPPVTTIGANRFECIGNPYASAIDFRTINKSGNIDNTFYVWDPLLTGYNIQGGYQTISSTNGYIPIPGGTSNYSGNEPVTSIQSGQAFFMHTTGAGSGGDISFTESCKIAGSKMQFRENIEANNLNFISTKLYGVNNTGNYLADGNMLVLDVSFSNSYNKEDVLKLKNSSENFGIFSEGKLLSIEARQFYNPFDTLQYQLNNVRIQPYQLKINLHIDSINTLMPVMVDRYTNIQYPLNWMDSLTINFNVISNPLSYASNRFYMLMKPVAVLPLDKIELTGANINSKTNKLLFKVYNPSFIKQYEVQRTTNGNEFSTISIISLNNNNQHQTDFEFLDQSFFSNTNFYRIKVVNIDGGFQYSNSIKIGSKLKDVDITMSSNVILNNQISLLINSAIKGNLNYFIADEAGRILQSNKLNFQIGSQQITININANLPKGIYFLKLFVENNTIPFVFKIIK
jgi:parallel beta-helix repeat protein